MADPRPEGSGAISIAESEERGEESYATLPELDFSMSELLKEQVPAVMGVAPLIEALVMLNDTPECNASQSVTSLTEYRGGDGDSSQSQPSVTEHHQVDHSPEAKQRRPRTKEAQIAAHATKHQVRDAPEKCRRGCKTEQVSVEDFSWLENIYKRGS